MPMPTPRWWSRGGLAAETCPISLEPIRKFRRPPFELKADPELQHRTAGDWFDARILASYLVSRGDFTHPVSRRALTRDECVRLDEHLLEHGFAIAAAQVLHAYDHRDEYIVANGSARRLDDLRREADAVMAALFSAGGPVRSRSQRIRPSPVALSASAQAAASPSAAAVERDGGLTVVDDDLLPGRGSGGVAVGVAAAAESFPALPQPTAPRMRVEAVLMHRPMTSPASEEPTEAAALSAGEEAAAAADRALRLATAFERGRGVPSSGFGVARAAAAAARFSEASVAWARAQPQQVQQLEQALDAFVRGEARRQALPPMPRAQRVAAAEAARQYGIATIECGAEPARRIDLLRTDATDLPALRLSDAVRAGAAPAPAALAALAPAAAWQLELTDIECSRQTLLALLSPMVHGGLEWRGADTAVLSFGGEAAAREALALLGGGRRGAFRVRQPRWATPAEQRRRRGSSSQWSGARGGAVAVPVAAEAPTDEAEETAGERLAATAATTATATATVTVTAGSTPWRSRSALARAAAAAEASPSTVSVAAPAVPMCAGGHVLAPAPSAPGGGQQRLGWDATRRLIWAADDAADAQRRLRAMGIPAAKCESALSIAGDVDAATRCAAATEWLLLHLRSVYCVDGDVPPPPEPANPFTMLGVSAVAALDNVDEDEDEELPLPPWRAAPMAMP